MGILIGTSGFSCKHWRGVLYPEGVGPSRYLEYYAQSFPTVEINASFYRPLSAKSVENWCRSTAPGFRFAVKAPKNVTHVLRLENAGELMVEFAQNVSGFGEKLGPVLVQLPPSLRANEDLLRDFLDYVPDELDTLAFEFRHDSWFTPAVAEIIRDRGALVAHDYGGREPKELVPGRIAYYRLHGPGSDYASPYPEEFLESMAAALLARAADGTDVYVYFNNDIEGHAVRNALRLMEPTDAAGKGSILEH